MHLILRLRCVPAADHGSEGCEVPSPGAIAAALLRPPPASSSSVLLSRTKRRSFTVSEVRSLYAAAASDPLDDLLLTVLFTTGLRIGGVSRLPCFAPGERYCETVEKGGRVHAVPLAPAVHERALAWRPSTAPSGAEGRRYLFPARHHPAEGCVSTSFLRTRFKALCQRAGVHGPHAHPHSTRHTVAVALRLAGRSLTDVQAFLGHARLSTTVEVYARPELEPLLSMLHLPWWWRPEKDGGGASSAESLLNALVPPPSAALGGGAVEVR